MARDPADVIRALLAKTEANGCTPGEASAARAKAEEIAAKYGYDLRAFERPKAKPRGFDHGTSFRPEDFERAFGFAFGVDPMTMANELDRLRRAAEAAKRRDAEAHRAKASEAAGFGTIRECAEHWIKCGLTTTEVLAKVRLAFPAAETKEASIRWYASKMRKEGRL